MAGFTYSCAGLTCRFDGSSSTDTHGAITSYAWDFGDATSGSGAVVSHSYSSAGTRTVTLTVTDDAGKRDTQTKMVTVRNPTSTGFRSPTMDAPLTSSAGDNNGFEANTANAYADDGSFAVDIDSGTNTRTSCLDGGKDKHLFYAFSLPIPAGATIKGIEVRLDAKVDSAADSPKLCVQLSSDGGASWTFAKTTPTLATSESTYILGGSSILWGRPWTVADFADPNFRVRMTSAASSPARDFSLDWVAVRVTY